MPNTPAASAANKKLGATAKGRNGRTYKVVKCWALASGTKAAKKTKTTKKSQPAASRSRSRGRSRSRSRASAVSITSAVETVAKKVQAKKKKAQQPKKKTAAQANKNQGAQWVKNSLRRPGTKLYHAADKKWWSIQRIEDQVITYAGALNQNGRQSSSTQMKSVQAAKDKVKSCMANKKKAGFKAV